MHPPRPRGGATESALDIGTVAVSSAVAALGSFAVRHRAKWPAVVFLIGVLIGFQTVSGAMQVRTSSTTATTSVGFRMAASAAHAEHGESPPLSKAGKHRDPASHQASADAHQQTGETSGMPRASPRHESSGKYHMLVTSDDNAYNSWQVQICYYWYKEARRKHPDSDLGGFTRLLHTGAADNLMDVIPTVVVDPLPPDVVSARRWRAHPSSLSHPSPCRMSLGIGANSQHPPPRMRTRAIAFGDPFSRHALVCLG